MSSRISAVGFSLLLLYLISAAAAAAAGGSGRELWCVAKNNAEDADLQAALDWTCSDGGADCGAIQNGGPCYDASDLQRTASFAFNDYYVKHGPADENCNFANTAALTSLNPSHDKCTFPSARISSSNGNVSVPLMTGTDSADLSSSSSILHHWDHGLLTIPLFSAILLTL